MCIWVCVSVYVYVALSHQAVFLSSLYTCIFFCTIKYAYTLHSSMYLLWLYVFLYLCMLVLYLCMRVCVCVYISLCVCTWTVSQSLCCPPCLFRYAHCSSPVFRVESEFSGVLCVHIAHRVFSTISSIVYRIIQYRSSACVPRFNNTHSTHVTTAPSNKICFSLYITHERAHWQFFRARCFWVEFLESGVNISKDIIQPSADRDRGQNQQ